jgi:hypothetical protein
MAYDKGLAQRVREILEEEPGFDEKKMFGGLYFSATWSAALSRKT